MKTVLSIGKLEHRKRPNDFIEIAREVIKLSTEEISFFWVGEGDLLEKCKKMTVSEVNIQFLGFVSEAKKKRLLKNCDVYISTSEFEGFNLTIGEALFLKKPVVAYALQVYRDVYNGFVYLVPFNMESRFVQTIIHLLENPPMDMLKKANKFIQNHYSPAAIRSRLLEIFSNMISG